MPNPNMLEAIYGPELINILQELEEIFPPINPQPAQSMNDIMFQAGQRSVVEWLHQRTEN